MYPFVVILNWGGNIVVCLLPSIIFLLGKIQENVARLCSTCVPHHFKGIYHTYRSGCLHF